MRPPPAAPPLLALTVALLALAAAGCRGEIPRLESDPGVVALKRKAPPGDRAPKLALAPVELAYRPSADLESDSARYPARIDTALLGEELAASIGRYTLYEAPRRVRGSTVAEAAKEAAAAGCDVLIRPVLERLDCVYRGHNGSWIPNMFLWFMFWVPSFWIADEEFAVEGELSLRFHSVASERLLYTVKAPIEEHLPLDDFERGWSLTGIVTVPSTMGVDDWGTTADSLAPIARFAIERAALLEIGANLAPRLVGPAFAEKDRAVFALVCGVSRHAAAIVGPEAARSDAERVARVLREDARVPAKNIRTLVDQQATAVGVEQGLAELAARARPGDTVLLSWSGLGAAADGAPPGAGAEPERFLLPFDTDPKDVPRTAISLARLRLFLSRTAASRTLVLLDASFAGRRAGARQLPRAGAGAEAGRPLTDETLARFTAPVAGRGFSLLVASGPLEDAIDLPGAGSGLFTFALEQAARGAGDLDGSGVVSTGELLSYVGREVEAEAGLEGVAQHPRLFCDGRRLGPLDPEGRGPWLPGADLDLHAAPARTTAGETKTQ